LCAGHGEEYNNEWTLQEFVYANFNSDRSKVNGYIPRGLSSFGQFTFSGTFLKNTMVVPYTKGFHPKFTTVFGNLFVIMSIKLEIAKKVEIFNKTSLASDGILAQNVPILFQHLKKIKLHFIPCNRHSYIVFLRF